VVQNMRVPDILNPFIVGFEDRRRTYPSMAAYVYSQALKSCGKDGDIIDTPAKLLPQKFEGLFQECVRSELRNYMKEGYAYATSVTTHPERHATLKNATDITVETWGVKKKLNFLPEMIKGILKELQRDYSDRVEDDQDIYYAEIAKVMNYYAAAKKWLMKNGNIRQFLDADEDLFAVPSEYDIGSVSLLIDQQKRITESARVQDLPRVRRLQEMASRLQELTTDINEKAMERDYEEYDEYPDYQKIQNLSEKLTQLEAQKEELKAEFEALSSETGIDADTLRQIQLRRNLIPEPVKIVAQIGGLTPETRRILREVIIEENWRELNRNISRIRSETVFKEYSRNQWESYPDRGDQDFETVFRRETGTMPQDILEVAIARVVELYNDEKLNRSLSRKIANELKPLQKVDPEKRQNKRADITAELKQMKEEYDVKEPNVLTVRPMNGEFSCTDFPLVIEGRDDETGQYDGPYQYALVMMAAKYQGKGGGKQKRRMDRSRQERIARRIILVGAVLNKNMAVTSEKRVSFTKMMDIYQSVRKNDLTKTLVEPLTQGYLRLIEQNFRQEYQSIAETDPETGKRTVTRVPVESRSKQLKQLAKTKPRQQMGGSGRKHKRARIIRRPEPPPASPPYRPYSPPQGVFGREYLPPQGEEQRPDLSFQKVIVNGVTYSLGDLLLWRDWVNANVYAPIDEAGIIGPEGVLITPERVRQIRETVDAAVSQGLISGTGDDSPTNYPMSPTNYPMSPTNYPMSPTNYPMSPAFDPTSPAFDPTSPAFDPSVFDNNPTSPRPSGFSAGSDTEQERIAALSRRELVIIRATQDPDFQEEFIEFLNRCPGSEPEDFKLSKSDRYTEELYPTDTRDIPLLFGKTLIVPSILSSICRWFNDELNKANPTRKLKRRTNETSINPETIRRLAIELADKHPSVVKSVKKRLEKADNFIKRRLLEVYNTISAIVEECCVKDQVTGMNIYYLLYFIYSRCIVVNDITLVDRTLKPLRKILNKTIFRDTQNQQTEENIQNFLKTYVTNLFMGLLNAKNVNIFEPKTALSRNRATQQQQLNAIETKTAEIVGGIIDAIPDLPLNEDFRTNPEERMKKLKKIVNGSFNPQNPDEKYQILRRWEFFQDTAKYINESRN